MKISERQIHYLLNTANDYKLLLVTLNKHDMAQELAKFLVEIEQQQDDKLVEIGELK